MLVGTWHVTYDGSARPAVSENNCLRGWGGGAVGGRGDRLCEENIMQHPATLHQPAPGHGELGLGRVWLMINGHYKLQHSISLPHTLDTLSSFSTPNVHIMWICGWMRGPKSRHIFHCSPYHIGVSCFELTIQQRTVQHSQQIYITIQKFALSKWNAMISFNEISEEHISGAWLH